jgi:acyl carrier protein
VSIRLTITSQIENIAAEQHKKIAALDDKLLLSESGLDSLCFAILVARLEDELGVDPFTASEEVYFPTTLGEFIELYERRPA